MEAGTLYSMSYWVNYGNIALNPRPCRAAARFQFYGLHHRVWGSGFWLRAIKGLWVFIRLM